MENEFIILSITKNNMIASSSEENIKIIWPNSLLWIFLYYKLLKVKGFGNYIKFKEIIVQDVFFFIFINKLNAQTKFTSQ